MWLGDDPLHDRLSRGFTLLRFGNTRRAPEGIDVLDIDDAAARDLYDADCVLVRPDQHVAWRGSDPADAAALVDTVLGRAAL